MKITYEINILKNNKEVIATGRLTNHCIHNIDVKKKYRRKGFATFIIN